MNDQVGEFCLFTEGQNVVLGSLCSVVNLNNLNPELCGFIKSLNNLLNNDKRITTFGLSEVVIIILLCFDSKHSNRSFVLFVHNNIISQIILTF